jgi:uncharacterized DUF497 family protein
MKTLAERGLDFADTEKVFAGKHFDRADDRRDYGEPQFITIGYLNGRFVAVTWTLRERLFEILERAKGFEPSTPTLARSCSTPELHPHPFG